MTQNAGRRPCVLTTSRLVSSSCCFARNLENGWTCLSIAEIDLKSVECAVKALWGKGEWRFRNGRVSNVCRTKLNRIGLLDHIVDHSANSNQLRLKKAAKRREICGRICISLAFIPPPKDPRNNKCVELLKAPDLRVGTSSMSAHLRRQVPKLSHSRDLCMIWVQLCITYQAGCWQKPNWTNWNLNEKEYMNCEEGLDCSWACCSVGR